MVMMMLEPEKLEILKSQQGERDGKRDETDWMRGVCVY